MADRSVKVSLILQAQGYMSGIQKASEETRKFGSEAEKLAAIGQLAAGVMHEINNPLATIGACVAAIQGRLEDGAGGRDAIGEYLEIIDKEVERCTGIVDRLAAAVRTTLDDPEVRRHLASHGVEPTPSTPEELARFIREETTKWAPIIRATGATPD